mmetsp:Transcript_27518/g.40637  ORF Transcript_27518/g.40637 Transcript_27518/m.40637 type:complete len:120 (-) Transcript_27518:183-542(-)
MRADRGVSVGLFEINYVACVFYNTHLDLLDAVMMAVVYWHNVLNSQRRQISSYLCFNYFVPFTTNIGSPEFILATAPAALAHAKALVGLPIISATLGRLGVSTCGFLMSRASISAQSAL